MVNAQTSLRSLVRGFAVCIHTIAVGLCHICDIGIFSSDIYEGIRLLSVYTQLSSGVIRCTTKHRKTKDRSDN